MNLYRVDNTIGFPNTYPLDSDLSSGQCYPIEQLAPDAIDFANLLIRWIVSYPVHSVI